MARLRLLFTQYEDIPEDVRQSLWDQNISLDDVDYLLITTAIDQFSDIVDDSIEATYEAPQVRPNEYDIERLINRADNNRWYKAIIYGRDVVVGIAYH